MLHLLEAGRGYLSKEVQVSYHAVDDECRALWDCSHFHDEFTTVPPGNQAVIRNDTSLRKNAGERKVSTPICRVC